MDASKYLTGVELQPLTMFVDDKPIEGFEIRLKWIDIKTSKPRTGEPLGD